MLSTILKRPWPLLAGFLLFACESKRAVPMDGSPDSAADAYIDASMDAQPASPLTCQQRLPLASALGTREQASQLMEGVRARGFGGAIDGSDEETIRLRQLRLPRNGLEPGRAVLDLLSELNVLTFPESELAVLDQTVQSGISRVRYGRTRVGGLPAALGSYAIVVVADEAFVNAVDLWMPALQMSSDDAVLLTDCATAEPPIAPSAFQFQIYEFNGCETPAGQRTYQSSTEDSLTWASETFWFYKAGWHLVRNGIYTIAEENYWSTVRRSTAYCPHSRTVGFRLVVDVISGEILSYTPGIDCVVC